MFKTPQAEQINFDVNQIEVLNDYCNELKTYFEKLTENEQDYYLASIKADVFRKLI